MTLVDVAEGEKESYIFMTNNRCIPVKNILDSHTAVLKIYILQSGRLKFWTELVRFLQMVNPEIYEASTLAVNF